MYMTKAYAMRTEVALPFQETLERVRSALQEQGFGVLTEVDVRATMREKLGAEFRDHAILGACNPPLSRRALEADLEAGLVLPCNVVVYGEGDRTVVTIADPETMMSTLGKPGLDAVARKARGRLEKVIASLGS